MRQEDIDVIVRQDTKTLAKWWCELNVYDWPKQLPDLEFNSNHITGRRAKEIMDYIKGRITEKECLREWNSSRTSKEDFKDIEEHPAPTAETTLTSKTPSPTRRAFVSLKDFFNFKKDK